LLQAAHRAQRLAVNRSRCSPRRSAAGQ
jgi:hypothetical protein